MSDETLGTVAPETTQAPAETPAEVSSVESSSGSEPHTNTEGTTEPKLIPVPADKWREANQMKKTVKSLQAELDQLRAQAQPQVAPSYTDEDPVAAFRQSLVADIKRELGPALSVGEEIQQQRSLEDVAQRPYADQFSGEIAKNFVSDELAHLPVQQRMDQAYKLAIGANIDKIVASSKDGGYQAAYEKISEKQAAGGITSDAGKVPTGDLDINSMTPEQYEKHRRSILEGMGARNF